MSISIARTSGQLFWAFSAVVILGAAPAAAQDADEDANARSERIATTYQLTTPVLMKVTTVSREFVALARKDPAIFKTADTVDTDDTNVPAPPAVRAIFARVGLTQDEYGKFVIAMTYAAMSDLAAAQSAEAAEKLRRGPPVLRANAAFIKAHDDEFKALQSAMKELRQLQEGTDGSAEDATQLKVTGSALAGVNSEIQLDVTGGPRAGRYTAKVTEGGCSYGLTKPDEWGNQYSITTQDPKKFSSLQLIVPDAEAAAAGTESFNLMVGFGPLISLTGPGGTQYKVETRDEGDTQGQGRVSVEDSGAGATITFDGKTKDGVGLKGVIKCHTVMRMTPAR